MRRNKPELTEHGVRVGGDCYECGPIYFSKDKECLEVAAACLARIDGGREAVESLAKFADGDVRDAQANWDGWAAEELIEASGFARQILAAMPEEGSE